MYGSLFINKCSEFYRQQPKLYDERLRTIIQQLEAYCGFKCHTEISSPLPAPALSLEPNIIKIAPSIVVLSTPIVAGVMAHEFGHHYHKHMQHRTPPIMAEYEADCFSISFLETYNYDIKESKDYRLSLLTPIDGVEECSDLKPLDFKVLNSVLEKRFNEAIQRQHANSLLSKQQAVNISA